MLEFFTAIGLCVG